MGFSIPVPASLGSSIDSTEIVDGAIVDADVNASAAIGPTKLGFTKNAYTQTYSVATRTQALTALETTAATLATALVSDPGALLSLITSAINENKKLINGVVDDLQANNIAS